VFSLADKLHPQSDISLKNNSTADEVKNDAYNLGDVISGFQGGLVCWLYWIFNLFYSTAGKYKIQPIKQLIKQGVGELLLLKFIHLMYKLCTFINTQACQRISWKCNMIVANSCSHKHF